MEVRVRAPNRIDLAGGTTDLYPLFLLMDGGCTVNAAISVYSRVHLRSSDEPGIRIVSKDLGLRVDAADPAALPLDGPLGLICRAVRALPPPGSLEIETSNQAPAGSGLGASSALLIALLVGLLKLRREDLSPARIINLAGNLETAAIGVPTGQQDYIAAFYGGISFIDFGYDGFTRESAPQEEALRDRLEKMVVLAHTGEGRFSGINNWEVTKAFIADQGHVRGKLLRIRDVARRLTEVMKAGKLEELSEPVDEEWQLRRTLAPGVSTRKIESIMTATTRAGASANKICGAGGGGCMITLAPPAKRLAVEQAIVNAGGEPISFRISPTGVAEM
jgi:D-glycero-alpha-D-manno-heptose-7-phosphate kinase